MKICRRKSFGRRMMDKRPSTAIMSIPCEDRQKILEDIAHILREMPSSKEYFEEVLSEAQRKGFSVDKEPHIG